MGKMCNEWSDAEFLLSHGNPQVCILIMLIDVKMLVSNNSTDTSQGFTKMICKRGAKLCLAALCFFCGVWKALVLICY